MEGVVSPADTVRGALHFWKEPGLKAGGVPRTEDGCVKQPGFALGEEEKNLSSETMELW